MASFFVFFACTWADVIIKGAIYLKMTFLPLVDAGILYHLMRICFLKTW